MEEVLHHLLASLIGTVEVHHHFRLETTIGTVVVVDLRRRRRVTLIVVITIEEAEEEITVAKGIALAVPIDTVVVVVGADTSFKKSATVYLLFLMAFFTQVSSPRTVVLAQSSMSLFLFLLKNSV